MSDFDWDTDKDRVNWEKHGIPFSYAQKAFLDKRRVIAEDLKHSHAEKRYYCFGEVDGEVVTVWFTYRNKQIRIIGADIGERGKKLMKKKINYSNEPMDFKVIDDFLPSPQQLALKKDNIRVTITLSKSSVNFFKRHARKVNGHYQSMIRKILDSYAAHYEP